MTTEERAKIMQLGGIEAEHEWLLVAMDAQVAGEKSKSDVAEPDLMATMYGLYNGNEATFVEVDTYLKKYKGVPVATFSMLGKNAPLLRRLVKFTAQQQEDIVLNPALLVAMEVLTHLLYQHYYKTA